MNINLSITRPLLILSFHTILLINLSSCDTNEPNGQQATPKSVKLKLLDVSCTEAFIKIIANETVIPLKIVLKKDEAEFINFTLTKTDTVIIDTALQLNTTYTYQTAAIIDGKSEKSDTLRVKTLNITSGNYIWQKYEFGGIGGSSTLYDAAIIDENNIWAVGAIYTDTTGEAYNAVHWNGSKWELKRVNMLSNCNSVIYPPLKAIWAFSENNIVFTSGGSVGWYDGENLTLDCKINSLLRGAINKLWGSSSNDLYAVGNGGSIVHYENREWRKIESGTTTDLNDIWGYRNEETKKTTILTVASNLYSSGEYRLLTIRNDQAVDTLNYAYERKLTAIWFKNEYSPIIAVGEGTFENRHKIWQSKTLTEWLIKGVRGTNSNDIFLVDDIPMVQHFNGVKWDKVAEFSGNYIRSIFVKKNKIVLVGSKVNNHIIGSAVVIIGTGNN